MPHCVDGGTMKRGWKLNWRYLLLEPMCSGQWWRHQVAARAIPCCFPEGLVEGGLTWMQYVHDEGLHNEGWGFAWYLWDMGTDVSCGFFPSIFLWIQLRNKGLGMAWHSLIFLLFCSFTNIWKHLRVFWCSWAGSHMMQCNSEYNGTLPWRAAGDLCRSCWCEGGLHTSFPLKDPACAWFAVRILRWALRAQQPQRHCKSSHISSFFLEKKNVFNFYLRLIFPGWFSLFQYSMAVNFAVVQNMTCIQLYIIVWLLSCRLFSLVNKCFSYCTLHQHEVLLQIWLQLVKKPMLIFLEHELIMISDGTEKKSNNRN